MPPVRCPRGATARGAHQGPDRFVVSYMSVQVGPPQATAGLRAGRKTSMPSPGLSPLVLKSGEVGSSILSLTLIWLGQTSGERRMTGVVRTICSRLRHC